MNSYIDFKTMGQLIHGKKGEIQIGNDAFEFHDDNNGCIEIKWNRIQRVRIKVLSDLIEGIYIEYDRKVLAFTSKDNISLLKAMRRYLKRERFIQEKTFIQKLTGKA